MQYLLRYNKTNRAILVIWLNLLKKKHLPLKEVISKTEETMAVNPNYEQIGKAFTQQYYALFDNAAQRPQLAALYNVRKLYFFEYL